MRRFWGCLGLVLLLASALLLGASQLLPRLYEARWADASHATGQIIGFVEIGSVRRPLVSFVASDGDPYIFEAEASSPAMRQGQMAAVRYFLEPYLQASLETECKPAQVALGVIGCALMAAGLASLLTQLRKTSLRRQLMQYGTRLAATVTAIEEIPHVCIAGHRPHTVICTLRSPLGIGEWTVKSGWIWKLPPGLRIGGTVPILVDANRPSQYCVLVEEASPSAVIPAAP